MRISIFSKKRKYSDLSWMVGDLNTHILPGLDDGSSSSTESMDMLQGLAELKLKHVYCTPRINGRLYPNNNAKVLEKYEILKSQTINKGTDLHVGAEYMISEDFENMLLADMPLITLPNNHVLIEMSCITLSKNIDRCLELLTAKGYTPILANPERYVYYHKSPEKIKKLKDQGALILLNILSSYGYFGNKEKEFSKDLINAGLVDFLGTDTRHDRHIKMLQYYVGREDISEYFKRNLLNESLLTTATSNSMSY